MGEKVSDGSLSNVGNSDGLPVGGKDPTKGFSLIVGPGARVGEYDLDGRCDGSNGGGGPGCTVGKSGGVGVCVGNVGNVGGVGARLLLRGGLVGCAPFLLDFDRLDFDTLDFDTLDFDVLDLPLHPPWLIQQFTVLDITVISPLAL